MSWHHSSHRSGYLPFSPDACASSNYSSGQLIINPLHALTNSDSSNYSTGQLNINPLHALTNSISSSYSSGQLIIHPLHALTNSDSSNYSSGQLIINPLHALTNSDSSNYSSGQLIINPLHALTNSDSSNYSSGASDSRQQSSHGLTILLNDERDTAWDSLVAYFRQPIVYLFCGLPLLAPSLVLIIVPAVDPRCSRSVLAVGLCLFSICVFCFVTGVSLAIFNRWAVKNRARHTHDDKKKLMLVASSSTTSGLSTPRTSSSTLSPQNLSTSTSSSSRRSSKSRSSSASSGDSQLGRARVLPKPKRASRISLNKGGGMRRKRGVKFSVERLPSLIEEDTVRTISRGNSQSAFQQDALPGSAGVGNSRRAVGLASPVSKDNIEELKDYLNVIGLGGGTRRPLHPPADTSASDCRRARSLEEKDLSRGSSRETTRTGPFSSREDTVTRKSLTPRPDRAVLVSSSHERAGIGMPSIR
ncbi:hypothetical protein EGW08_009688 [Elysia chlorotica]|uniref:Uncharacterized protein n=1 Tax=Elysia chlorotica TaxID=188477 RepID=A0A3S1A4I6_ELYCH|nr:hypothetical protein EGW08_009688 [Elysia chlorotica]